MTKVKNVYDELPQYIPELNPNADELRALLRRAQQFPPSVDRLIAGMLRGQQMPQTAMPEPLRLPPTGHVQVEGSPYTMRPGDIQAMYQKAPAWHSKYGNMLLPDATFPPKVPMPNPGMPPMQKAIGRPMPPPGLLLGPDAAPRPPGLELPQGMKIGPDGEQFIPDTFYQIPEDPEAEDV